MAKKKKVGTRRKTVEARAIRVKKKQQSAKAQKLSNKPSHMEASRYIWEKYEMFAELASGFLSGFSVPCCPDGGIGVVFVGSPGGIAQSGVVIPGVGMFVNTFVHNIPRGDLEFGLLYEFSRLSAGNIAHTSATLPCEHPEVRLPIPSDLQSQLFAALVEVVGTYQKRYLPDLFQAQSESSAESADQPEVSGDV